MKRFLPSYFTNRVVPHKHMVLVQFDETLTAECVVLFL